MTPITTTERARLAIPTLGAADTGPDAHVQPREQLHAMCEAWAWWARTRHLYDEPGYKSPALNRLARGSRSAAPDESSTAPCNAELAAFHLAVLAQPDTLSRQVFELHYHWRVRNIKSAARELGIGRQHWYTLLRAFRERAWSASRDILRHEQQRRDALSQREPLTLVE